MIGLTDIALRLGAATLAGGVIGLNRDLHGKPTGVRTLGLVGLGAALIVVAIHDMAPDATADPNAVSRVVQGLITGIGFLGAGVIIRDEKDHRVRGLTTAACVWMTACLGVLFGMGTWRVGLIALALIAVLMVFGGPVERTLHALRGGDKPHAPTPH